MPKKPTKNYKKAAVDNEAKWKKLKAKRAEKKSATRKEPGDKNAVATLVQRLPVFTKSSQLIKNMAYYEPQVGALSLAGAPQFFIKANDMYDPTDNSGGHQPIGHDQMMAFYEHFCVIRSNIAVTFSNPSPDASFRIGIILSPDTGALNYSQLIENGYCKTATLAPRGSAGCVKTLYLDCDVKNYFGKESYKDMLSDERLVGDIGNSPTERVHYGIFVIPAFSSDNVNVLTDIVLNCDTIYYEPKKIPVS